MSFLDKLATSAKSAAKSASDYTKKTISDLKAPPASVQCQGCPRQVPVPKELFDWTCSQKHRNDRTEEKCTECGGEKWTPPVEEPKTVTCSECQAVTTVPNTTAARHLKQAAHDTKTVIQKTATAAQESIVKMKSAPEQFHCSVCDSLLFVPKGAWMCQSCATSNEENSPACSNQPKCSQKKTQQKVLCGICNQAVLVPTSNFMNSLGHAERQMSSGVKKAFYTIADKPHIICPRCKKQVLIPAENKDATAESKQDNPDQPADVITVQCEACSERTQVQRVKQSASGSASVSAGGSASGSVSGSAGGSVGGSASSSEMAASGSATTSGGSTAASTSSSTPLN